jgi:serine/threonine protein kinase
VLYEALSGALPFSGANYNAVLHAVQTAVPRAIRELRPDVSAAFAAVVERAMAKDPAARFPSARAMAEALDPWVPAALMRSVSIAPVPMSMAPTLEFDMSPVTSKGPPRGQHE